MTKNGHVYAIYCRPEVAGDVTSCRNVKTNESYEKVKFEDDSSSSFRDIKKKSFRDGGGGHRR